MINGNSIRKFRNKRKITQKDFAKSLNISQANLSNIENGKTKCSSELEFLFISLYKSCFDVEERKIFRDLASDNCSSLLNINISNFIISNDLENIMDEIIKLNLDKRQLKILFNNTLDRAKTLKKTRS